MVILWKKTFNIGLCLDINRLISFKLDVMLDTIAIYILIPLWMTLTFILACRWMRKHDLLDCFVTSFVVSLDEI